MSQNYASFRPGYNSPGQGTPCVPRALGLGVCDESDIGDMSHQRGNSGTNSSDK